MYRYLPTLQQARQRPKPQGPVRTLREFAQGLGLDYHALLPLARIRELPRSWCSGARTSNRYEVRELQQWLAAVREVQK